jgi:hypothetical protein
MDSYWIVLSMVVAISLGAFGMYSVQAAYFPELFDARYRYTGIAVCDQGYLFHGHSLLFMCELSHGLLKVMNKRFQASAH